MALAPQEGNGFSFDLCRRNALLTGKGVKAPTQRTTGTTLAGLIFKVSPARSCSRSLLQDGVILAADTRATAGVVIADKNTEKLRELTENIYCAGSGTSADCDHVCHMVSSALTLHGLDIGRQVRVITAETMFKNHLRRSQPFKSAPPV